MGVGTAVMLNVAFAVRRATWRGVRTNATHDLGTVRLIKSSSAVFRPNVHRVLCPYPPEEYMANHALTRPRKLAEL